MPAERGGALFPAMRAQIPLDRFTIVPTLDPGIVVELPQLAQLRKKSPGMGGGVCLRQAERRSGRGQRQNFDIKRRRQDPPACCGPDYIEHTGVPWRSLTG